MAMFKVGQRVKFARYSGTAFFGTHRVPIGSEGTIIVIGTCATDAGTYAQCLVAFDTDSYPERACDFWQLDPLVNEGSNVAAMKDEIA